MDTTMAFQIIEHFGDEYRVYMQRAGRYWPK